MMTIWAQKPARLARASRQASRSVPSISSVSIPKRGKMSAMIYWQEPKSARAATTRSPAFNWHIIDAKTAAMPLAVARQASAPSRSRRRSSKTLTVGLP